MRRQPIERTRTFRKAHAGAALLSRRRVFIAPPWREIFAPDAERKQDFAEAERTYQSMAETYGRLGYELVALPCVGVAERLRFVLDEIGRPTAVTA